MPLIAFAHELSATFEVEAVATVENEAAGLWF
jgi:hypothetical protein